MVFTNADKLAVGFLLFFFFIICTASINYKSITNDELAHIPAGYSYWKTFDFRMNTEHPPLMKLLAGIPLLFLNPALPKDIAWKQSAEWSWGHEFLFTANSNADQIIFWARIPMILIAMLLGLYIFKWASELYNKKAGYLALILFTFSPLVIAHSRLVTTDVGVGAFMFICLYYFWRFCQAPSIKMLIAAGIAAGLAFSAKFTGIYLIPMLGILAVVYQIKETAVLKEGLYSKSIRRMILNVIILFVIGFGVLVLSYGVFEFPKYFTGFKQVTAHSVTGHKSFLFGEYSSKGFWNYFLLAFIFKTPLPMLILLGASIILYKWTKHKNYNEAFLFIPFILYLASFMVNELSIGIRHILSVYPFMFVFIGKLATLKFRYKNVLGAVLLGWYIGIALLIFPHYLPYFNEFAGGPGKGYNILIDSNIDWGQDLKGLKSWMDKRNITEIKMAYFGLDDRDYRKIRYKELKCRPESGLMAVSVNRLVGFDSKEHQCLSWLRESSIIKPIDNIGYSIYIFNVSGGQEKESIGLICLAGCKKNCLAKKLLFEKSEYTDEKCLCECSAGQ